MEWCHDALADDLARWVRGDRTMAFVNVQVSFATDPRDVFGPDWHKETFGFRPDVFVVSKVGRLEAVRSQAIEVKVQRADFQREMRSGKWRGLALMADTASFACPEGLIRKHEVPKGMGLWWRGPRVWRQVKRPKTNGSRPPGETYLHLLMAAHDQILGGSVFRKHHVVPPRQGPHEVDAAEKAARGKAA